MNIESYFQMNEKFIRSDFEGNEMCACCISFFNHSVSATMIKPNAKKRQTPIEEISKDLSKLSIRPIKKARLTEYVSSPKYEYDFDYMNWYDDSQETD